MNKQLLVFALCLAVWLPAARADNVTVHGTVGILEAPLVTKTMEPVGTVQVWNTRNDMNVVVTPDANRCRLRRVQVYMSTDPAPPLIPEAYPDLVSDYEALLAECHALVPDEPPEWLADCQEYLEESQSAEDVNEAFEDLLKAYADMVFGYEGLVNALLPDEPDLWEACQEPLAAFQASVPSYQVLLTEPDFGEWPYGAKFKKPTADPYSLTAPLSEIKYLQWGPWGMPWLDQRLVTVAVRAELETLDVRPVTFTAWALNPNLHIDLQRTGWGDDSLAMVYELQHPSHGQFAGPVHGFTFTTQTQSGLVGLEGGFPFFPGETIELWIGDVYIGSAPADQRISPLDIFPTQDMTDPSVVNLARLLLSLDDDGEANGAIEISDASALALEDAMGFLGLTELDFANSEEMDALNGLLFGPSIDEALDWLEQSIGSRLMRKNISKTPEYAVDKPKLDIMPVWVPARTASGLSTTVDYYDADGNLIDVRTKAKPLFITYTEKQEPNINAGITRSGSDIITAVSMDDGATWKRFNVSHMAGRSSFTLETEERFPGDCRGPRQRIVEDKILVVWTSAYARGGKPSFSIKGDDDYPYDDPYAVDDVWGVRGRQGSVDYDLDKDVGDQGIGEIPYYALWACRGVLVWEGNAARYPDREIGDMVWFKPERLTSGRRDAFFAMAHGAKNVGFAIAWQEDPGGLLPGSCKGGGDGWSGATVHKKTDIWYSFIPYASFDLIDENFVPADHSEDEFGGPDEHGQQPEISNRPKWLVPMSLPVRVSDNNTVNTDNLKVELNPDTGLPLPGYIPLEGAEEDDWLATEHESEGSCDDGEGDGDGDGDHDGSSGPGGGWGMARYAYLLPSLGIVDVDLPSDVAVWEKAVEGDYRSDSALRWYRFINKAGMEKTVVVTNDGRLLDGNTGACRPALFVMPGGWTILGYEETKGLGIPPEGEHGEEDDVDRPEPDDKGKNVIYHSFKYNKPDQVSAGNILNLPALDDDGNLIPIYYKDADGEPTEYFRQFKTENARRIRFIAQPKPWMGSTRTSLVAVYKQGREGNGKPSDVFAIRAVVPAEDMTDKTANPYKFSNLQRFDTSDPNPDDNGYYRYQRKHMNMSGATAESMDPVEMAGDNEGNSWNKVGKWKQYQGDLSAESFANPYSDAKAHRGFLRGDLFVFAYSFTPNWGRLGGDHMDFYVRRSFDGAQTFTTDPNGPEETVHTVIERDPETGEFTQKQYRYGRGEFEPGRNVSLLKGNSYTVVDPRLVPPMGPGTVNPTYPEDDTAQDPSDPSNFTFYVAYGTGKVLHGLGEPLGETDTEKADVYYTRTTDGGTTFYQVPWLINPDSPSPGAGETVYRFDWLAKGPPHQGHSQIRMHPSGTRLYAIWHQFTHGDEDHLSPHDVGNDIWFRRIDFVE